MKLLKEETKDWRKNGKGEKKKKWMKNGRKMNESQIDEGSKRLKSK